MLWEKGEFVFPNGKQGGYPGTPTSMPHLSWREKSPQRTNRMLAVTEGEESMSHSRTQSKRRKHCTRIQHGFVRMMNHRKTSAGFAIPIRVNIALYKQQLTKGLGKDLYSSLSPHNPCIRCWQLYVSPIHTAKACASASTVSLDWHPTLQSFSCSCHPGDHSKIRCDYVNSLSLNPSGLLHHPFAWRMACMLLTDIKAISNVVLMVSQHHSCFSSPATLPSATSYYL